MHDIFSDPYCNFKSSLCACTDIFCTLLAAGTLLQLAIHSVLTGVRYWA